MLIQQKCFGKPLKRQLQEVLKTTPIWKHFWGQEAIELLRNKNNNNRNLNTIFELAKVTRADIINSKNWNFKGGVEVEGLKISQSLE